MKLIIGAILLAFTTVAQAHVCEGEYRISNVQNLSQRGDFVVAPGQPGSSICPPQLKVRLITMAQAGTMLVGQQNDPDYSSGNVESSIQIDLETGGLSNSVMNSTILAINGRSRGASGQIKVSSGNAVSSKGIMFLGGSKGENSIRCTANQVRIELKYTDHWNNSHLVCDYNRN
jgi:hypothetical protein